MTLILFSVIWPYYPKASRVPCPRFYYKTCSQAWPASWRNSTWPYRASFLICKIEVIKPASQICGPVKCAYVCDGPNSVPSMAKCLTFLFLLLQLSNEPIYTCHFCILHFSTFSTDLPFPFSKPIRTTVIQGLVISPAFAKATCSCTLSLLYLFTG